MANETFKDIEKLESDLWEAADHLRANSKLTSSDYFMPVLGVIFLRHAANRFQASARQIEADQARGKAQGAVGGLHRPAFALPAAEGGGTTGSCCRRP